MKMALKLLKKYHLILIWLLVLFLFGYSLWRFQAITNPKPDEVYLKNKQQTAQDIKIQIKDDLKAQIEGLQNTPVNTQPAQLGTPDPFNP